MNSTTLSSFDELLDALEQHQAFETETLSIRRGNKRVGQSVRLGLPG